MTSDTTLSQDAPKGNQDEKKNADIAQQVENKKNDKLTSLYWMIVTAAYLGYSFLTNQWDRSWIIWPVAGVVYGIVIVIADTLREKD